MITRLIISFSWNFWMISGTKLHRESTSLKVERLCNRDRLFAVLAGRTEAHVGHPWGYVGSNGGTVLSAFGGGNLRMGNPETYPQKHETPYFCTHGSPHIPKKALPSIQKTITECFTKDDISSLVFLSILPTFTKVKRNNSFQNKNDTIFKNSLIILDQKPVKLRVPVLSRFRPTGGDSRKDPANLGLLWGGKSIQIHQKPAETM